MPWKGKADEVYNTKSSGDSSGEILSTWHELATYDNRLVTRISQDILRVVVSKDIDRFVQGQPFQSQSRTKVDPLCVFGSKLRLSWS